MWQCTLDMTEEGINIWPLQISAPLRSTTWIGKTIRFIWLFRPKTAEITIRYTRATSITFKYMVDKLEQSWATVHKKYCQNGGQKKKPAGKNHIREKTRQEIWVEFHRHYTEKRRPWKLGCSLGFVRKNKVSKATTVFWLLWNLQRAATVTLWRENTERKGVSWHCFKCWNVFVIATEKKIFMQQEALLSCSLN